jgi:hypothetical protein
MRKLVIRDEAAGTEESISFADLAAIIAAALPAPTLDGSNITFPGAGTDKWKLSFLANGTPVYTK